MLNPFPIQWLALFAYLILRVFVGLILLYLGYSHFKNYRELKAVFILPWWPYGGFSTATLIGTELILGTMFILGFYTQYAALGTLLMCFKLIVWRSSFNHSSLPSPIFYFLLLGTAFSLLITGGGALGFDLPI